MYNIIILAFLHALFLSNTQCMEAQPVAENHNNHDQTQRDNTRLISDFIIQHDPKFRDSLVSEKLSKDSMDFLIYYYKLPANISPEECAIY